MYNQFQNNLPSYNIKYFDIVTKSDKASTFEEIHALNLPSKLCKYKHLTEYVNVSIY